MRFQFRQLAVMWQSGNPLCRRRSDPIIFQRLDQFRDSIGEHKFDSLKYSQGDLSDFRQLAVGKRFLFLGHDITHFAKNCFGFPVYRCRNRPSSPLVASVGPQSSRKASSCR